MTDYEKVTDFTNLYKAYKKSKSGKGHKISALKFNTVALDGVLSIKSQLEDKSYRVSPYNQFTVYEPKERIIKAGSFKDKIVQHSVCDNVLLPLLKSEFIFDNYAGQLNKGTLLGLDRLSDFMSEFYSDHGANGFILKCDIIKFFYTIDHDILKDIVGFYVKDNDVYWLCEQFIDSTNGIGIPLGNQISQVFALLYLNGLDHFIKTELGIQYYGRYMDDFYIIHHSKEYLKYCLSVIQEYVSSLKLTLNGKTQIIPFKNGVKFLGFHTYITPEGMVNRRIRNENKRNAKRKYVKMASMVRDGRIPLDQFVESYQAWRSHASRGSCNALIENIDKAVNNILM